MRNRADEIIYLMRSHPGYGYRRISGETLSGFIRYEWSTHRWAMMVDQQNRILGWLSWYCFDHNSLQAVKKHKLTGCVHKAITLHNGPHLYISNVVVRQETDKRIFRQLMRMARKQNPDAVTCSAFCCNRREEVDRWSSFKLL